MAPSLLCSALLWPASRRVVQTVAICPHWPSLVAAPTAAGPMLHQNGSIMRFALPLLLLASMAVQSCLGQRMPDKCGACRAVASELADRLDKERPRNHLDMRHRLDKHGNRYGKVIDYKMSELRVIELLEGLCSGMGEYEYVAEDKNASTPARWARTSELGANRNINRVKMQEDRKLMEAFCHDLVERHEEDVAHAIKGAKVDASGISDYICFELSKQCPTKQEQPQQEEQQPEAAEGSAAEEAEMASAAHGAAAAAAAAATSDEL